MVSDGFRTVSDGFGSFSDRFGRFRIGSDRFWIVFEPFSGAFRTVSDDFGTLSDRFRTTPLKILKFQISIGQGWGARHGRTERHGRAPALAN